MTILPSPTDLIGRYFQAFDVATGASTEFEFITMTDDARVDSQKFHHAQYDGQGGLIELCRLRGESELTLPRQRTEAKPGVLRQLVLMMDFLKRLKAPFKSSLDRSASMKEGESSKAHESLTTLQTSQIQALVKSLGVSTTAFLTWSLHQAIGVTSGRLDHSCHWGIPVNLRGPLKLRTQEENYAVSLFLAVDSKSSAASIHKSIHSQLDEGVHWGSYRLLAILGRLPMWVYVWIVRRDELTMKNEGRWFAVLSNLGSVRGSTRVISRAVIAPTDPTTPITATALSWNDRMALGLRVHASFHRYGLNASKLLDAWTSVINQSVSEHGTALSSPSVQDLTRGEG